MYWEVSWLIANLKKNKRVKMKKLIISTLLILFNLNLMAQTPFKTTLGLGIDLGNGNTMLGPQLKHKFGQKVALQGQIMFSDYDFMYVGADYQYGENFPEAKNFAWYVGIGPQIGFGKNHTSFSLRPQAGLEFKLPEVPLGLHFDWKPWWSMDKGGRFTAAKFTLGVKYVLK